MSKERILVSRLRKCYTDKEPWDPALDPWGCGFSWSSLSKAPEENLSSVRTSNRSTQAASDPNWHAARILFLAKNTENRAEPITLTGHQGIEAHLQGLYCPDPVILDGWHRFFAHIHLGIDSMECEYDGDLQLLDFLRGDIDDRPTRWL